MTTPSLDALETTAIEACKAGGAYLRDAYRSGTTTVDAGEHDVKSSADTAAEERILAVIHDRFPDHPIEAEESGVHEGSGRCLWLVDPLDGTNNFEAGLPSFATGITVLEGPDDAALSEPVLGVVYAPVSDDLYVGRRDHGVRHDGQPVAADSELEPAAATVVSVIGHDVKRDPEHAAVSAAIDRAIEDRCKRRLESWSPTVHWGLLARGRLDGIVCYRPDREEQLLGELFAVESGLRTDTGDDWFVAAGNDAVFEAIREVALEHAT
ncbi:inositol monophosphatase family protein [Natronobacterium gregoryi]|uniref:fructose-bisphosphatase n=1 Tax=Natronobacterium gregoryi (strain ATCC 43098 / DSM 3393 / CCM 3738 / CIP 104747 / IAM 13177 / JCM 8860 / NBRC 102187 / NCIMB 2189 / SP2) TaxID=797304 RepID=L0AHE8_NATGS|nr:inositol monophosphatase family protein [Natronobacterium gregoryi]AFZ72582.1 inositol monophosphatase/fructose-1,6-bisphosphatase family protein [Natronobacterium gregoryi SP2]